jgi:plastocyanin
MRVIGLILIAGVAVLGACGGGGDSQPGSGDSTATPAVTPTAAATLAPITGTIHEVRMVGDAATGEYRYEPDTIVAKAGDGIKFIMISVGPHNVAFDPATLPAGQKDQLWANMGPNSMDGSSPMLITDNEEWTLSLGNLTPGMYPFFCTPHLAMNMRGAIVIQ